MIKSRGILGLALTAGLSIAGLGAVHAQGVKTVGGAPMYPSKTIVENAVNSKDHTTLVTAVKAAGLVDTLSGAGPFTVFAPTNRAFGKLPKGTVEGLVQPQAKAQLTQVLTYHVVPGRYTAADLMEQLKANGGRLELTTVEGDNLLVRRTKGGLRLTDTKGRTSNITIPDVMQSNGVIHVIDTVLMPS
ncbi:fasciclin domain-containing protein [Salinarimonas soli]|uniref:Fasciclin domain-containing protein n=1 Tax=Salinarimonas soli TaxID=1638099 RepID=A0A5B2VCW0_9HYPH|nr:fasciclin domain-containing protein [Salinarimonas soli]KAA2236252.1 fasciclin domain-containing protein [Salinarimonas soli]